MPTLSLSDEIYGQLEYIAKETDQTIEEVIVCALTELSDF